jgi:hypothetical protein
MLTGFWFREKNIRPENEEAAVRFSNHETRTT